MRHPILLVIVAAFGLACLIPTASVHAQAPKPDGDNLLKTLTEKNNEIELLQVENQKLRDEVKLVKDLVQQLKLLQEEVNALQQKKLEEALSQLARSKAVADAATSSSERLARLIEVFKDETAASRKNLQDAEKLLLDKARQVEQLRASLLQAQAERDLLQARNEALLNQVKELSRQLANKQIGNPAAAPPKKNAANPPPVQIEGSVKEVSDGLVRISIGSDAGLQRNHTLEVFRLDGQPKYLGQIRIVDVTPREAIGQFLPVAVSKEKVRVGDRVSSKILE
jgi:valyl-tRNA synthetase